MKISFTVSRLLETLKIVLPFVPSKPTHPIFGTVLFKGNGIDVELVGFDGLSMGKASLSLLSGSLDKDFCLTTPSVIYKLLESFPNGSVVNFDLNDSTLKINVDGTNNFYEFPYLDGNDYPEELLNCVEAAKENKAHFTIEGYKLREGFNIIKDSYSTDISKQILTGIHFLLKDDRLAIEATNGHKACWYKCNVRTDHDEEDNIVTELDVVLLPAIVEQVANADLVTFYFDGEIVNVRTFTLDKEKIPVCTGIEYASTLKQGVFPRLAQLIPKQFENTINFDVQRFINVINRMKLINDSSKTILKCTFDNGGKQDLICLETQDEAAHLHEEIPIEGSLSNWDMDICFNLKYVEGSIKILGSLGNGQLTLQFNQPNQPAIYSRNGVDAGHLIMPITVNK